MWPRPLLHLHRQDPLFLSLPSMKTPLERDETRLLSPRVPITHYCRRDVEAASSSRRECGRLRLEGANAFPDVYVEGGLLLPSVVGSSCKHSRTFLVLARSVTVSTGFCGSIRPSEEESSALIQLQYTGGSNVSGPQSVEVKGGHRGVCRGAVGRRRSHLHAAADAHRTCSRHADR